MLLQADHNSSADPRGKRARHQPGSSVPHVLQPRLPVASSLPVSLLRPVGSQPGLQPGTQIGLQPAPLLAGASSLLPSACGTAAVIDEASSSDDEAPADWASGAAMVQPGRASAVASGDGGRVR